MALVEKIHTRPELKRKKNKNKKSKLTSQILILIGFSSTSELNV